MANIINRSNHPVAVKRIEVEIWTLRDEIEAAISERLAEAPEKAPADINIEDIKQYYITNLAEGSADQSDDDEGNDNLDSSGNPLDDDALAMMAAISGGEEADKDNAEEANEEDQAETTESEDSAIEENSEADDEADDEAAALAAEMMADQGISADDEAANLAAQMLADQGITGDAEGATEASDESTPPETFTRVLPPQVKRIKGFIFLSDVHMDKILFFAQENFVHGQNIVINLLVPKPFSLIAEVKQTTDIARKSKIISSDKPKFRVHCEFLFKFSGERSQLREFLQSIEPEIPAPPKRLKRPETDDDDDDDFDDLGF